jgi:type II secretory pathway pseudopilin PulG
LGGTTGQTTGFGTLGGLGGSSLLNQQQNQQQQQQQFQMQQLQQQQQQQQLINGQEQPLVQQQLAALSNSPYGGHLLRNTFPEMSKKEDIFKPLSPIAQRPYITEATSPVKITSILPSSVSDSKGGLSQTIKIAPKPLNTISLNKVNKIINLKPKLKFILIFF